MKNLKLRTQEGLMDSADEMPIGWVDSFAEDMVNELMDVLFEERLLDSYQVLDVKEKFGGLRWYAGGFNDEIPKSYWAWLDKYEELSMHTCVVCGTDADLPECRFSVPICNKCEM